MFDIGDKIVCVNRDLPCGCELDDFGLSCLPVIGRYYVVTYVAMGGCTNCGYIELSLKTPETPFGMSWPCTMFRKIRPSSRDIFKLAGVSTTTRHKEPV